MKLSLQMKILLAGSITILLITISIITFTFFTSKNHAINQAKEHALSIGEEQAYKIKNRLDLAFEAARSTTHMLEGLKKENSNEQMSRDMVNNMLSQVLSKNSDILGIYTAWEPNKFDGKDHLFKNKKSQGSNTMGRFSPYWTKGSNGPTVEALEGFDAEDFYLTPKSTQKEYLSKMFQYQVQGKNTLMVSLLVPLSINGEFYGIGGVDISVDFLQKLADSVNIFKKQGRIALITNSGTLAGVTGAPQWINKSNTNLDVVINNPDRMKYVRAGSSNVDVFDDFMEVLVPIHVGTNQKPWAVSINVPLEVVIQDAYEVFYWQLGISICLLILALIALWGLSYNISSKIKKITRHLGEITNEVNTASKDLSAASQGLSEGASQQASSIEETSASLEEMNGIVDNNVYSCQNVLDVSNNAKDKSEIGNDTMIKLKKAMEEILTSNEKIVELVRIISNIGKKTEIMDEIVFQTKLLSFNASVEAERAGEHGRGFAVVAQEVGNLAQMSGKAAGEIAIIVKESVVDAEEITNTNKEKVKQSTELVQETAKILSEIMASSASAATASKQVLDASQEQSKGIKQINEAIAELDKTAQENSATAEETATSSEELSSQADGLNSIVRELNYIVYGDKTEKAS